jgi:uncharacterized protein YggE
MYKKYIAISILAIIAVMLSACGTTAYAQSTPEPSNPRTITVTGSGKAYITPDWAYISIGVHTEDKDAAKAVANNNSQSLKVSNALKSFNIDLQDIRTTNFSIYPQQQYDQSGKLQGILYVVDNTVYVTLRNLDKIGELLNAVVEAGANSINGVQFDTSDKTKALSDARKDAVADAQTQAKELAQAAGITLGAIQSISTSGGTPTPVFEGKGGGGVMTAVQAPISPGQMVVNVDVSIVYEIQ